MLNLEPSSEYVISLKAFNYAGEGIPAYETTVTREMTSRCLRAHSYSLLTLLT